MRTIIYALGIFVATITVVNGAPDELSPSELKELEKALQEASEYMDREAKDEDSAICVGVTRSGKSTLVNYLIGNPLIGERLSQFRPITISKTDNTPGPEIGIGYVSQTTIPTRWTSRHFSNMSIWDAPGFDDNRGPVQDITNAFYINQLLRNVKSLKIILTVDFNDISRDNVGPLLLVFSSIHELLKDRMRDLFESIAFIVTKVPDTMYGQKVDMSFINSRLKTQILNNSELPMAQVCRDYVKFLTENNHLMGLFKRAKLGAVNAVDVDVNIFEAIRNTKSINRKDLADIKPSMSTSSIVALYKARDVLSSTTSFQLLQYAVNYVLDSKINQIYRTRINTAARDELNEINADLTRIKDLIYQAINPALTLREKINILRTIDPSIEKVIREQKLIEKVDLLAFIDNLMNLVESGLFEISFNGVLLTASNKAAEAIVAFKLRMGEISQKESQDALERQRKEFEEQEKILQEELRIMQEESIERKNKLYEIIGDIIKIGLQIIPPIVAAGK